MEVNKRKFQKGLMFGILVGLAWGINGKSRYG